MQIHESVYVNEYVVSSPLIVQAHALDDVESTS